MFRVVVQDSRQTPTSGKVVAQLGHYNPHTKELVLDKDSATTYLNNGAQPSNRVAVMFKNEGLKLPKWVKIDAPIERKTKNTEKLRKNRPAEETAAEDTTEPEASTDTAEVTEAEVKEAEAETETTEDKAEAETDSKTEAA